MLKKIFKLIINVLLVLRYGHFKNVSFFKKDQSVVLWICPSRRYWISDNFIKDFSAASALSKRGIGVYVYIGDKIGRFEGRNIMFSFDRGVNKFGFKNYLSIQHYITSNLSNQRNRIYPNSHEMNLWENKALMHRMFEELNINTPKTVVLESLNEPNSRQLPFPFLIKEEHSFSSQGIHLINNKEQLDQCINEKFLERNKHIILQKLINMRRDLRVILVGDEIVLHYWRINKSKDWKPTATGYGSEVDFVMFPEKWRHYIIEVFKKLNLVTGAFDITWENDDLESEPLILEVSPNYQPNPVVDVSKLKVPYGEFKKKIGFGKNSYTNLFVKTIFSQQEKIVNYLIDVDNR
ncbi:MAG: hypothetical protein ABJF63_20780, partial [Ekhidna sp.]